MLLLADAEMMLLLAASSVVDFFEKASDDCVVNLRVGSLNFL